MAKVTWLGSHMYSRNETMQFGIRWKINVGRDIDDEKVLRKCWYNQFYQVDGWKPEDEDDDQPIRDDGVMDAEPPVRRLRGADPNDDDETIVALTSDGAVAERDLPQVLTKDEDEGKEDNSNRGRRRGRRQDAD